MLPLVGYAFAIASDYLRTRWTRSAERHQRAVERDEAKQDRREEFEIRTLTALRGVLNDYARTAMRLHLIDLQVAKSSGRYGTHQFEDKELDERHRLLSVEMSNQVGLVLDPSLRDLVSDAHDLLASLGLKLNVPTAEAEAHATRAFARTAEARDAISNRLRAVYSTAPAS